MAHSSLVQVAMPLLFDSNNLKTFPSTLLLKYVNNCLKQLIIMQHIISPVTDQLSISLYLFPCN